MPVFKMSNYVAVITAAMFSNQYINHGINYTSKGSFNQREIDKVRKNKRKKKRKSK